jgi:crotonobetainyl-CoA:carnitine CoA-transferase CaiB-like acyl-CoA transferase
LERLATSGVPHGPIYDVAGAFAQTQIRDGDFLGTMDTPGGETVAMRTPLLIDGVRPALRRGPRRLGEDTDEVFGS